MKIFKKILRFLDTRYYPFKSEYYPVIREETRIEKIERRMKEADELYKNGIITYKEKINLVREEAGYEPLEDLPDTIDSMLYRLPKNCKIVEHFNKK